MKIMELNTKEYKELVKMGLVKEEKETPEKLMQLDTRETRECIIKIQDKINEICDYLKSKGE